MKSFILTLAYYYIIILTGKKQELYVHVKNIHRKKQQNMNTDYLWVIFSLYLKLFNKACMCCLYNGKLP